MPYRMQFKTNNINLNVLVNLGFNTAEMQQLSANTYLGFATAEMAEQVKKLSFVSAVTLAVKPTLQDDGDLFPIDKHYKWNTDNFGPLIIPKKGWTVALDSLTMPIYYRAIRTYEGNKVEKIKNEWFINDKKAKTYTFKMDYYWMMGDNRHNSIDSRYWGFVPEDHVVGKALFIWMSFDENGSWFNKIRWNRLFRGIK